MRIKTLILLFAFSSLSGILRKWVISSNEIGNLIMLIQLALPYILFYKYSELRKSKELNIYLLILCLLALNPLSETIYHTIMGLIIHGAFFFLIFTYIENRDSFPMEKLIWLFVILCFIQIALGVAQYSLPPDHVLNRYANSEESIAQVGGVGALSVRVTGTFSYLAGYSAFMLFVAYLVWAMILLNQKYLLSLLIAFLGFIGIFMNGGRASFVLYALVIIASLLQNAVQFIKIVVIGIVLIFVLIFTLQFFPNIAHTAELAYDNWMIRVENGAENNEQELRVFNPITEIIFYRGENSILGNGLGGTYQGANKLWGESAVLKRYPEGYEEEPERLILEGGYILLIARLVMFVLIIKRLLLPKWFSFLFFSFIFFYSHTVFNAYNIIYIFLGIALVDRVYYLNFNSNQNGARN